MHLPTVSFSQGNIFSNNDLLDDSVLMQMAASSNNCRFSGNTRLYETATLRHLIIYSRGQPRLYLVASVITRWRSARRRILFHLHGFSTSMFNVQQVTYQFCERLIK